ncbi:MAG: phosphatase PAP2 family protein [Thermoanaerobaculia bacterium]
MRSVLSILLGALLAAARPLSAEEPPPPREIGSAPLSDRNLLDGAKLILFDTGDILTAPIRWDGNDWLKFGIGAAAVTTTVLVLDQPVREASQRSRTTSRDDVATVIEGFGSQYSWAVIGAFAVAGWGFDDTKSRRVVVDALGASLIAGGIVTTAVKYGVGRYRPGDTAATWYAQPFSGNGSFPSGHTTQAFALAAVISGHYEETWVRVSAFFVAGCVGLARIQLDAHYASDVLLGAIIGTAVGGTVVSMNEKRREASPRLRLTVTPILLPRGGGLQASLVF